MCVALSACSSSGANDEGDPPEPPDPEPVVPGAPSGLQAASGDGQVVLDWNGVSQAQTYTVYRSTSSGSASSGSAIESGLSETEYTDTDASNGVTYFYQVTAVADEEGEASGEVSVTPFSEPPTRP